MKRMKGIFILAILSLFLGVTSVTSYAESGSVSVEAGIQFSEGNSSGNPNDSDQIGDSSYVETQEGGTLHESSTESGGSLPKTGMNNSNYLFWVGVIFLISSFSFIKKRRKKKKQT